MMYDAGDKKQVDQRQKRQKLADARAGDDVRAVMSTEWGRRFVHGVLGLSGVRDSVYRPGDLSHQRHQDYLLGRQSVGLQILEQIERYALHETERMAAEARAAAKETQETEEAELQDVPAEQEQSDG